MTTTNITTAGITYAAIYARARREAVVGVGQSEAEFQYELATSLIGMPPNCFWNAAYYVVQEYNPTASAEDINAAARVLIKEKFAADIAESRRKAGARKYVGWSDYSAGPVRFAD